VRGPRRLVPYAAGSGRPVLAFPPSFACLLVPAAVKAGCCAASAYLALSSPVFVSSLVSFYRHRLRVLGNTDLNFISIGHIIASETEEEIFRKLGSSHHYICIFLCDLRGLSARGVRACQLSPLGAPGA
jgi:hypothetical protein